MFEKIEGQPRAVNQLKFLINSDRIAQSYLFFGPAGVGKLLSAIEFAKTINCPKQCVHDFNQSCPSCRKIEKFVHPDIDLIFPTPGFEVNRDGTYKKDSEREKIQDYLHQLQETPYDRYKFSKTTSIRIDTIRRIEYKIQFAPREGKYRVIIIAEADKFRHQAENAFLKTLEEPPDYVVIILTTTKISALLPTIISRCQKVRFNPIIPNIIENHLVSNHNVNKIKARISARIANGSLAKAILISQQENIEARNKLMDFIEILLSNDLERIYKFSDNFQHNSNKETLRDILDFLILWFGDLIYLRSDSQRLLNIDKREKLEEFNTEFKVSDNTVREIIEIIEQAKYLLNGNVNYELVVIDTFFQIRKKCLNGRATS